MSEETPFQKRCRENDHAKGFKRQRTGFQRTRMMDGLRLSPNINSQKKPPEGDGLEVESVYKKFVLFGMGA
jgi:hypothetical protein